MSFDDRFADRQAHTHPVGLCREEGIKNMLQVHGVKTNTGIRHANDDVASVVGLRPDRQDPRPITDCTHRVDAVHDEVKNDLLQLDSIGQDCRKIADIMQAASKAKHKRTTQRQKCPRRCMFIRGISPEW